MAICRGFEPGTTENSGRDLKSLPLDCKPKALIARPRCLLNEESIAALFKLYYNKLMTPSDV